MKRVKEEQSTGNDVRGVAMLSQRRLMMLRLMTMMMMTIPL